MSEKESLLKCWRLKKEKKLGEVIEPASIVELVLSVLTIFSVVCRVCVSM